MQKSSTKTIMVLPPLFLPRYHLVDHGKLFKSAAVKCPACVEKKKHGSTKKCFSLSVHQAKCLQGQSVCVYCCSDETASSTWQNEGLVRLARASSPLSLSVVNKRRILRAAGGPLRRRKPLHSSAVVNEVFSPESCAVYSSSIIALIFQSLFAPSDCRY